jgi:hypothetical protein
MTHLGSAQTTQTTNISAADRDFISSTKGFMDRYLRNIPYFRKRKEAYEHTEAQYAEIMGKPRYSSYESFRTNYTKYFSKPHK